MLKPAERCHDANNLKEARLLDVISTTLAHIKLKY